MYYDYRQEQYVPNMPEEYGAITTTTTKETFVAWMPRDARRFLFMATKSLNFLTKIPEVEKF